MRVIVFATAAVSSVVALVGFAGAAQASATIDLIWIDVTNVDSGGNPICLSPAERNCPQFGTTLSSVAVTDSITLGVIVTAGAGGVSFAGVGVNYGDALPKLNVTNFRSMSTTLYLPLDTLPPNNDTEGWVVNLGAAGGSVFHAGIGLPAGASAYLGTVTFHKDAFLFGTFEIAVRTHDDGGGEIPAGDYGLYDLAFDSIISTATLNSAFLDNLTTPTPTATPTPTPTATPTPICSFVIEVNVLRAGGKTVRAGPNRTVNVTAKARILKGTAFPGTVIDTTLTIQALDGTDVIGTNSAGPIQLEIGKGGKGAKLPLDIPQCTTGFIDFVAEFSGVEANGGLCEETRTLRRECR